MNIHTSVIRDAGRTQVDPGSITVCALGPDYENILNEIIGSLKLL